MHAIFYRPTGIGQFGGGPVIRKTKNYEGREITGEPIKVNFDFANMDFKEIPSNVKIGHRLPDEEFAEELFKGRVIRRDEPEEVDLSQDLENYQKIIDKIKSETGVKMGALNTKGLHAELNITDLESETFINNRR